MAPFLDQLGMGKSRYPVIHTHSPLEKAGKSAEVRGFEFVIDPGHSFYFKLSSLNNSTLMLATSNHEVQLHFKF